MKKNEGKNSLKKVPTNRPNIPKNMIDNISINSNFAFDTEFISYINKLSYSIKSFYKCNNQNFIQIKSYINSQCQNNENNNIITPFKNLEISFSTFYLNAKSIFKKMKNYHNEFIGIH